MNSALFLDTSALVKMYVREAGSQALLEVARARPTSILSVSRVEMASAVWRRCRSGDITEGDAASVLDRLAVDTSARIRVHALDDEVLDRALDLLTRHSLRAHDALQLAGAVTIRAAPGALVFACADESLLEAARGEGLTPWNPADGSPAPD
jgi:predicted nucleic acid-binding protein